MEAWQEKPLGFTLVDETKKGALAVHHVSVSEKDSERKGVTLTGAWLLPDPDPQTVRNLLSHRITVGTIDGIALAERIIREKFGSADLAVLVASCEKVEADLNATWQEYRDAEPKKRENLKPLNAPTWPAIGDDGDAARILKRVGKKPYADGTPTEMRDILSLAYLVRFIMGAWYDLETERISRAYLRGEDESRNLYPPTWLAQHRVYWPKVA